MHHLSTVLTRLKTSRVFLFPQDYYSVTIPAILPKHFLLYALSESKNKRVLPAEQSLHQKMIPPDG